MTSRRMEDLHDLLVRKILSQSGLECIKSVKLSEASVEESGEIEDAGTGGEEQSIAPETHVEEEQRTVEPEAILEEIPNIFPTPSLRRVLPDRVRQIHEENTIHVLPEMFKTDIDPSLIPKISTTPPEKYIDILGEMVGCSKYQSSLAEYWCLETLANLLRRAQEHDLSRPTQATLILWYCEWMKEMQYYDAANRERMLHRFLDNMLSAARFISTSDHLPTPAEALVNYKEVLNPPALLPPTPASPFSPSGSDRIVAFEGSAYSCALIDLVYVIHFIYDLFSSDFQYDLVRSVFTFPPDYVLIDTPYQLHTPKRLYAPQKVKKEKTPKKTEKQSKSSRKQAPDTAEYLALMAMKAREEKELQEREEADRESWNMRSSILPLNFAADTALFDKYWPPPEPEPVPEPEIKKKGKRK